MSQHTDKYLVNEVKKGNSAAFDQLVLKYQYRVFKLVSRYINDSSEAMDLTQEAFIKAYKAIPAFRGESSFYTWMYRIAVNTAKNHIITAARKGQDILTDISEYEHFITREDSAYYAAPERQLIGQEFEGLLFNLIDKLPYELRTAILLREIEGRSYEEISSIMSCPVGTVRSRIFRAREIIEKRLRPQVD